MQARLTGDLRPERGDRYFGQRQVLAAARVSSGSRSQPQLPGLGMLVVLGVGPGELSLQPIPLVMGRRRVMGSPAGSRKELPRNP